MLYITPEKLSHWGQMMSVLQDLYRRGRLSRFVVDEAHCLSQVHYKRGICLVLSSRPLLLHEVIVLIFSNSLLFSLPATVGARLPARLPEVEHFAARFPECAHHGLNGHRQLLCRV